MAETEILRLAKTWLAHPEHAAGIVRRWTGCGELAAKDVLSKVLLEVGVDPASLMHDDAVVGPEGRTALSLAFEKLCNLRLEVDRFGERQELLTAIAYMGWREASRLELAYESQEWIRISESLVCEGSPAAECLKEFLALDEAEKTDELYAHFLGSDREIFTALGLLCDGRFRDPNLTRRAAADLFRWLSKRPGTGGLERAYYLGEAARLVGMVSRYLGRHGEAIGWLNSAREAFGRAHANEPLLAKVEVTNLIRTMNVHQHEETIRRSAEIVPILIRYGLRREELVIRINSAASLIQLGREDEATHDLEYLVQVTKDSDLPLYSSALFQLGQCLNLKGDEDGARSMFSESLTVAQAIPDRMLTAYAAAALGEFELQRRDSRAAVKWLSLAVRLLDELQCLTNLAYFRVYLGEALIASARFWEAGQQLALALPTIRDENMVPEGVHAAKLLTVICSNLAVADVRRLLASVQAWKTE